MNTTLLIQQLTAAVLISAVAVVAIQKIKVWFPAKFVEVLSGVISMILGVLMARYYANFDWIACLWVGFYSLIGAEAIYNLLAEKLKTYTEKKEEQTQVEQAIYSMLNAKLNPYTEKTEEQIVDELK